MNKKYIWAILSFILTAPIFTCSCVSRQDFQKLQSDLTEVQEKIQSLETTELELKTQLQLAQTKLDLQTSGQSELNSELKKVNDKIDAVMESLQDIHSQLDSLNDQVNELKSRLPPTATRMPGPTPTKPS